MMDRIYIHFADYYHIRRATFNTVRNADIWRTLSSSFKLSLLFSNEVVFPASSVFESSHCRELIARYPEFRSSGAIRMAAGDASLIEYLEGRAKAYDARSPSELLKAYSVKLRSGLPSFDEKPGSSTAEIREHWLELGSNDDHFNTLTQRNDGDLPENHVQIWNDIADRLRVRAFVPAHAMEFLLTAGFSPRVATEVDLVIESAYIRGYATALSANLLSDVPFLAWRLLEDRLERESLKSFRTLTEALVHHELNDSLSKAKSDQLFRLIADPEWKLFTSCVNTNSAFHEAKDFKKRVASLLEPRAKTLIFLPSGATMSNDEKMRSEVRTAILTALPIEFAAVRKLLPGGSIHKVPDDPNVYYVVKGFTGTQAERDIVVCMLPRAGNASSAAASASLQRSFVNAKDLIFCGIALGVPRPDDPGKHVRLGDVVASDRKGVINTNYVAKRPDGDEGRSQLPPPPARFTNALNLLEAEMLLGESGWTSSVTKVAASDRKFERPDDGTDIVFTPAGEAVPHPAQPKRVEGMPLLHRGAIGSSDALVKDALYRDEVAGKYGLLAMEMEGAGAVEASWTFGNYAMVVRGISDYGLGKNDIWHGYASLAAAAAALALIERV